MYLIIPIYEADGGVSLIRTDVLGASWLDDIRSRDMLDIGSASDAKLKGSGTTAFHLRIGQALTWVNFGVVRKLVVLYY